MEYPIKNVLVGLDMTDLDETLLKFAEFIHQSSVVENIYFINCIKNLNVPDEVLKAFPDLLANAKEERAKAMRELVAGTFPDWSEGPRIHVEIREGGIAKTILKASQDLNIDLIVLGRRQQGNDGGMLSQRIARRAACNMLIVPEGTKPRINRLMVPTDFSDHASLALEMAADIADRRGEDVEIIVQNVFTVPTGYHYTGRSYEDFATLMEENARREYRHWVQGIDLKGHKVNDVYNLDTNDDPVEDIYQRAREEKVDVLLFGAKGRTATTAFFIGSMAERMIQLDHEIPLLVVRPKGKTAGILDMLKEI